LYFYIFVFVYSSEVIKATPHQTRVVVSSLIQGVLHVHERGRSIITSVSVSVYLKNNVCIHSVL